MIIKKLAAVLTALTMVTVSAGSVSGYGVDIKNDDADIKLFAPMVNWPDNDGSYMGFSAFLRRSNEIYVVQEKYDGYTVKVLGDISGKKTECIIIPDSCELAYGDLFSGCPSLKGIYVPDSVMKLDGTDENITIVGNKNSYAEYFAGINGNKFIMSGDIDNDGEIGVSDLLRQMSFIKGCTEFDGSLSKLVADMNHDGEINILDLIYMKHQILEGDSDVNIEALALPDLDMVRSFEKPEGQSGYLDFAADFSDNILIGTKDQKGGSNRIYSPVSVYMAASMLAECTDGQSNDELMTLLGVSDKEELRKINRDMFTSLYFNEFLRYCRISNSLWVDDRFTCEEETIKRLADNYFAASFTRDLGSEDSCREISKWIYQNTSGKFSPEIKPDARSIFKLINTVTFKEKWISVFGQTFEGMFKTDGVEVPCTFMTSEEDDRISEKENYVKYTREFSDGFEMNIVLPSEESSPEKLLSDKETMSKIFSDDTGRKCKVRASVPKFSASSKFDLIETLKGCGVKKIFEYADVTPLLDPEKNMMENPPVADEITHEAVIEVDEEGCEAAAYTIIEVGGTTGMPYEPYIFTADRQFIYYISDINGTPLFVGMVNNPNEK